MCELDRAWGGHAMQAPGSGVHVFVGVYTKIVPNQRRATGV